ncbi:hypothetical protein N7474_006010 [Penicillium riverlandense]|uniref:uncharacterized protein n=1 Tax=Penicillium riverlandense TaxID=1903569 RepID=UPI0025470B82|nr:uncharacterized protein N7474_006010 [Penicillium riverlandense]KAJ5820419.1 hypothetical protein N7474_006010 [Penicillium riverlandense]
MTLLPPSQRIVKRPVWPVDERARTAVRDLQEGELLQLIIDYSEEEMQFANSYKGVDPEIVAEHFVSPSSQVYSFYRYPGSGSVVLIWTRHHWANSSKHFARQNGVRMDMIAIAKEQGIKNVHLVPEPHVT